MSNQPHKQGASAPARGSSRVGGNAKASVSAAGAQARRELAELRERIRDRQEKEARRHRRQRPRRGRSDMGAGFSIAFRVLTDLGVAIAFGFFAGRLIDGHFGTSPWATMIMLLLGMAAGIRNVVHYAETLERQRRSREGRQPSAPSPWQRQGNGDPSAPPCGNPSKDE